VDKIEYLQEANRFNELISLELNKYINKKISTDITVKQHLCLIYIGNQKQVRAGNLCNILDISKSSVSQILNRLEIKKLIKRKLNNSSKKEILVSLDDLGINYFKKYLDIKKSILIKYFSFLDIEEIEILYELNKKIYNHIRNNDEV